VSIDRMHLERQAAQRIRPAKGAALGISSQEVELTNGRYSVKLTAVGSGISQCRGLDVTRRTVDPTCDPDGFHIYLRDLEQQDGEDRLVWSAGYQPTRITPHAYAFQFTDSAAEISRLNHEIESQLTVCVAIEHDVELRRCRLTNRGNRKRRIELTSYVELVLAVRDADANHPTFSKLFVETEYRPELAAIVARRRPRGSDESERFAFHRLLTDTADTNDVEFETNRKRFLGRGRGISAPQALDPGGRMTGDAGAVLDPIGSLRTVVELAPGESRDVIYLLGAATGRDAIEALIAAVDSFDAASDLLAAVEIGDAGGNGDARWIAHAAHESNGSSNGDGQPRRIYLPAAAVVTETDESPKAGSQETLQFENTFGGFSADGSEYVIRLAPDAAGQLRVPPQPWVNVLANESAGCIVTERGAGYTWSGNSRHNRVTAWHNDPVSDPHAEAIWLRDEEADVFWSPLPGPTPAEAPYEVRHGFGYTTFRHVSLGLAQETTMFMAPEEPVKFVRLRIENTGLAARRLTLFTYQHWLLGTLVGESDVIATAFDQSLQTIFAENPQRELYRDATAFSTVVADVLPTERSHTGDRASFIGRFGDLSEPAAVAEGERLDGRTGGRLDPCAAWQLPLEIPAGETFECTLVLGESANRDAANQLVAKYRKPGEVAKAFDATTEFWRDTLSAIKIETPDRELDLVVNGWLSYQNLACRMWGRSAFYQPGGAFGFRDQLQDSSALVYHRPDVTRRQILRHASQQFVEGDVLHWWHADTNFGLRTRFSDDLVWLPFVASAYVATTGDEALLDEVVPFIAGEVLKPGHAELGMVGTPADSSATVYEHCCRALDRALTRGAHGLPLMGSGDWNDGMNRVGQVGQGESVWLGFFLHAVLGQMLPICERRGDAARLANYTAERERLADVLNGPGWDGGWYRRAYYDNGEPLGSASSDECQIDALAQAWAVLSGVAPRERADLAVAAVEERLVDEAAGFIRLLDPPFDKTPQDPGYIKGYVPGVRENGGQYTHGVLFFVRALAEMGRGTRAVELLKMMSPVSHTATAARTAVYQTEPYVVAADVYSQPPHVGRGGWTWYTGSAGWMFRVAVESIFGLAVEGGKTQVLRPSISSAWPSCKLHYRLPDGRTQYEITVENPAGKEAGVTAATVDGVPADVADGAARIALAKDGALHRVVVRL
jgi:N,N'-diacetylchitobiose phosphorylase